MFLRFLLCAFLPLTGNLRAVDKKLAVFKEVSKGGKEVFLTFPTEEVTIANKEGVVCSKPVAEIKKVFLWMEMPSGHSHGSTPTELEIKDNGCVLVKKVNFLMRGDWQIITEFKDKDSVTFTVPVKKTK